MNGRERVLAALEHTEPDRVPYDLGGTHVTTIHVQAWRRLCEYLGIEPGEPEFADVVQQVVRPQPKLLERLEVDTRGLFPLTSHNQGFDAAEDAGDAWRLVDEWGFTQKRAKDGFWWSIVEHPLDGMMADPAALQAYRWPEGGRMDRIAGLREQAERFRAEGRVVMLKGLCAGLLEMGQRLRGMENFLCDLLADPATAETLLDGVMEQKLAFWRMALPALADVVDIVVETDDFGTQESQLISEEVYFKLFSPRWHAIFAELRSLLQEHGAGQKGYLFFHSCGNVRPYLPDFIDMGVDILNPVHTRAKGMEPTALKKDFGEAITFWGGGVETQQVLPQGTPQEVRDDVRRNVEALAPGGGYVFNTVHNIQAEVPPENILAMWEAMREFGTY